MDSPPDDSSALAPRVGPLSPLPSPPAVPTSSEHLPLSPSGATNGKRSRAVSPNGRTKLTPLEKKARDRLRMKEQAKRRLERLQERDDAARLLQQAKASSSVWHQQEREEEELILRRLERDMVFAQKTHPAAAGYDFHPRAADADDSSCCHSVSPVFLAYSHTLCPVSQLPKPRHQHRIGASVHNEAAFVHPACQGFTMAKHDDSSRVSPVFFHSGFAKIPLERVVLENDDDEEESESDSEGDAIAGGRDRVMSREGARAQVLSPSERAKLKALMDARFAPVSASDSKHTLPSPPCCVCKAASGVATMGCPGCFTFAHERHHEVVSSQAAQRLKTPKTRSQEQEERGERHKALQRQLVMPSIYRQQQKQQQEMEFVVSAGVTARKRGEEDYYMHVLSDYRAIRKHRTIMNNFVTLHIKSLPVGNILSLRVDIKSSVAYVYELYRANVELPNRPIHLLLPTSKGLFYLDERIEDATDVRIGLVYGEFYLEDFNLTQQQSSSPSSSSSIGSSNVTTGATTTNGEFMLFSVAVLNENSTPQLLAQYLQQNFRILPHEIADMDHMPIHHAICSLPKAPVDRDLCQLKLLPHVQRMQAFGVANKQIAVAEQQREREQLLRAAYLEKKQAKLEHKKKQNQQNQLNGKSSAKVRRALSYFQYVCESTSLVNDSSASAATSLKVWEARLEKLWQCFQLLEEWKICKNGRLVEAETTEDTLALLKLHQQATEDAFDRVLERKSGLGPLLYPILCIGGGGIGAKKLVVKLGLRLGPAPQENREYGLLLDLHQDFAALEAAEASAFKDEDKQKMKRRGFTKKSLVLLAQEEEQKLSSALALCADFEWKLRSSSSEKRRSAAAPETATLFTSSDLLRPPFYQFKWTLVAKAYKQAMRTVAVQVAKLEEFNALARVLQSSDAILSKAQIEKWQSEADKFIATLSPAAASPASPAAPDSSTVGADDAAPTAPARSSKNNCLVQAARRLLAKKGAALLRKRALQRKQQIREREDELLRLQKLQEENELPRLSLVQQLKLAFVKDKAPQLQAMLELTPAEKLKLKASQLLDKVAAGASSAATAMKKEYNVRAL